MGNETGFLRVNRYAAVVKEPPIRIASSPTRATSDQGQRFYPDLDLIAQNTYRGWYFGEPWEFEPKAFMRFIAESGGGAVISNHTDYGRLHHDVDKFEPEEYRQGIEEVHAQVVFRDHPDEVPMYSLWNFRDFGTEKYKGARNTKGLLTYAGFKKDAWYLYRSFLRPQEPTVHLASKTYFLRRGKADDGVKAFSNAAALTWTRNGTDQGARRNGESTGTPTAAPCQRSSSGTPRCAPAQRDPRERLAPGTRTPRSCTTRRRGSAGGRLSCASCAPATPGRLVHRPGGARPVAVLLPSSTAAPMTPSTSFRGRGAARIATRRLSKPEARTDLSFRDLRRRAGPRLRDGLGSPGPPPLSGAGLRDGRARPMARQRAPPVASASTRPT